MRGDKLLGKSAPDFALPDQDGKMHKLSHYRGRWVVVYFYPKDDTPGCTTQACSFRDNMGALTRHDVVVLGISKDSVTSHKKFAKKFKLNFPLLSDEEKSVLKSYGAWGTKRFLGRESEGSFRMTFLVNPKGVIDKIYPKVTPENHAEEILNYVMSKKS